MEQYKQHNYEAKDYYLEGLRRDPSDSRCNTALSRLALRDGEYEKCVEYADKAIERLTLRNMHPTDTEALYNKGIALKYLGKLDEAYDTLWRAAWNYSHRSASYFALAEIDSIRGDYAEALEKLDVSLGLNSGHTKARNLRAAILRLVGCRSAKAVAEENAEFDMLDLFAQCELNFHKSNFEAISEFATKPENILTVLSDYMDAGLYESALAVADLFGEVESPMINYYKAYCKAQLGVDLAYELATAKALNTPYCFPYTQWDMMVLEWVVNTAKCADANYYLGCIYYDRKRYEDACGAWESCVAIDGENGAAWRNLSLYYFDKADDADRAKLCMEKALEYKREDPRVLFEYQQLLKNMNFTPAERLEVYEKYADLLALRDDCYLDKVFLTTQTGEYKAAEYKAAVSPISLWRALALFKLGDETEAKRVLDEMIAVADNKLANRNMRTYYGVGSPSPMPFEYNIIKQNTCEGSMLKAFALLGYGRLDEAEKTVAEVRELDPYNFDLFIFDAQKGRINI